MLPTVPKAGARHQQPHGHEHTGSSPRAGGTHNPPRSAERPHLAFQGPQGEPHRKIPPPTPGHNLQQSPQQGAPGRTEARSPGRSTTPEERRGGGRTSQQPSRAGRSGATRGQHQPTRTKARTAGQAGQQTSQQGAGHEVPRQRQACSPPRPAARGPRTRGKGSHGEPSERTAEEPRPGSPPGAHPSPPGPPAGRWRGRPGQTRRTTEQPNDRRWWDHGPSSTTWTTRSRS